MNESTDNTGVIELHTSPWVWEPWQFTDVGVSSRTARQVCQIACDRANVESELAHQVNELRSKVTRLDEMIEGNLNSHDRRGPALVAIEVEKLIARRAELMGTQRALVWIVEESSVEMAEALRTAWFG